MKTCLPHCILLLRVGFVALVALFGGCGSVGGDNSLERTPTDLMSRKHLLIATFDVTSVERCDRMTFVGPAAALGNAGAQDWIPGAEWGEPGQLNRDHAPCDSVIPFSRDNLMGYMWSLTGTLAPYTLPNEQLALRVWDRLERLDWVDRGTDMSPLRGLFKHIFDNQELTFTHTEDNPELTHMSQTRSLTGDYSLQDAADSETIASFQEHLVADYCHLRLRAYKALGVTCSAAVAVLARRYPTNPWFLALDKQHDAALEALEQVPEEGTAATGWGSAPNVLVHLLTLDALSRAGE